MESQPLSKEERDYLRQMATHLKMDVLIRALDQIDMLERMVEEAYKEGFNDFICPQPADKVNDYWNRSLAKAALAGAGEGEEG